MTDPNVPIQNTSANCTLCVAAWRSTNALLRKIGRLLSIDWGRTKFDGSLNGPRIARTWVTTAVMVVFAGASTSISTLTSAKDISHAGKLYSVPDEVVEKYSDLVRYLLESRSLDDSERGYWLVALKTMDDSQVVTLRTILENERRQVPALSETVAPSNDLTRSSAVNRVKQKGDRHVVVQTDQAVSSIVQPRLVVQSGLGNSVSSVAFSRNGTTIAAGTVLGSLKTWDVASGRELCTLAEHIGKVTSIAFSPNGKTLVSAAVLTLPGESLPIVKFWDLANCRDTHTITGSWVAHITFSPDGKTVVTAERDGSLMFLSAATGRELYTLAGTGHSPVWGISSIGISPDSNILASGGGNGGLKLWNTVTGSELHTLTGHKDWVHCVTFSPDGKILASGSEDHTVKLWDVANGRELRTLAEHKDAVMAIAFIEDGRFLISLDKRNVLRLWDIESGQVLRTHLERPNSAALKAIFSPDGKIVAVGDVDVVPGITVPEVFLPKDILKLRYVDTGRELRTIGGATNAVTDVAYSPDGKTLVSKSVGSLTVWNLSGSSKPRPLVQDGKAGWGVAYSPDGKVLASGRENLVKLWNVATGQELLTTEAHPWSVKSLVFSNDGRMLVSGSEDGSIKFWQVATGRKLRTLDSDSPFGYKVELRSVSISPDGQTLAAGYWSSHDLDGIKLWSVATGRKLSSINTYGGGAYSVAFSPNGEILASAGDKLIKLWDTASGREIGSLIGHSGSVDRVAFSTNGKTLMSQSMDDNSIRLWDTASGHQLRSINSQSWGANLSSDGRFVASANHDGTVRLWDSASGKPLATLISFSDGRWAVTDPEGRFDVADLEDMPHLHWVMPDDPMTPLPIETFMRDYYEPRLLPRILNGEKFKPVRALGDLNRVQPEVKIAAIQPIADRPQFVDVTLEAAGAKRTYGFSDKLVATAAHDLRLFRNGQLVGYAEGRLAEAGKTSRKTFRVRLPAGSAPIDFTAYAFNDDRVKSATARQTYTPPKAVATAKPRAYLITIGVNRHDNAAWNLRFAANDARLIGQSLASRLAGKSVYEAVVTAPLIADGEGSTLATKANLKAVLDVLAGRKADVRDIPGGDQLRQATPDDMVLISFSGHGFGEGGMFYLIPSDTGPGQDKSITPELAAHAISSDELSLWLRDVDAGDMAMIVDACHSAASVGDGFKPGPMGSRGLGQLAFDKGMRILAASQADEEALESDRIQQGMLSFALVKNGLEGHQADFKPNDKKITLEEWLSYGVSRVPTLAEEVDSSKVAALGKGEGRSPTKVGTSGDGATTKRTIQQPALFDFTKGRRDVVLEAGLK